MKKITQFEKECIRLSILYALNGDSSVLSIHAQNIAKYVYPKLLANKDYDEMELLAKTINERLKSILEKKISYEVKPNDQPVNDLIQFMADYNVKSFGELLHFDKIWYDDELGKYTYIRNKSLNLDSHPYTYQITKFDLNDLIVWQNLASLFDVNCQHCIYTSTDIDEEFFYGWKINELGDGWKFEKVNLTFNPKSKKICDLN